MDAEAANLDPPRDQTFASPAEEADFQAARQQLLDPPPRRRKLNLLLLSLAAFAVVWTVQGNGSPSDLAILVGVLIFHELGHAIGMRAFDGFADEYVWGSSAHPQLRMKLYARDGYGYMLSVTPGDDPNMRRMFDSFQMH
jgi:hypothetical protein